jgi:hypothetical protein
MIVKIGSVTTTDPINLETDEWVSLLWGVAVMITETVKTAWVEVAVSLSTP